MRARSARVQRLALAALSALMALALWVVPAPVHAAPAAAVPRQEGASAYTVGQCRSLTRDQLRAEIENAALSAISASSSSFDIEGIVNRVWADVGVDAVVDEQVALAVAGVRNDTSYWQLLLSGWSTGKAAELAEDIAEGAFTSEAFTLKLGELSTAVGNDIASLVNAELARAASVAFLCLRDYVGGAYTESLFSAFEGSAAQSVSEVEIAPTVDAPGVEEMHALGITGAGVLVITEVGRRVAAKISQKLAQRVAGKVVGRVAGRAGSSFLPVVGWVVGVGLIVWDLWEGADGALPQIEEALTSEEVKAQIRAEVADAVRVSLPEESSIVALETAVSMLEEWNEFCTDYALVCSVAEENASFRSLLETLPLDQLDRLAALENAIVGDLGRRELDRAIETGALDALLRLPDAAPEVIAATRSISETLAWGELAGGNLGRAVELGLPGYIPVAELNTDRLYKLLNLNDGVGARKVGAVPLEQRNLLLGLPLESVKGLAGRFEPDELQEIADLLQPRALTDQQAVAAGLADGTLSIAQAQESPAAPTTEPRFTLEQTPSAGGAQDSSGAPPAAPTAAELAAQEEERAGELVTWGIVGGVLALLALAAALLWFGKARRRQE